MRARFLPPIALGLLAGWYFMHTIGDTIEWVDEGMIVYPSWRVALGDLPYVAFQHLYGPSLFFLNGGLMRIFGADLRVVRLGLVAVRACVVAEVYVLSRRVAPAWLALLASALAAALWGTPIWLFNTPYATYYTTAFCLAGVILLARPDPPGAARLVLAGVLFGVALTFKQTQGALALFATALALLARADDAVSRARPAAIRAAAGAIQLLVPVAAIGFAALIVRQQLATATIAVLLAPGALACSASVRRTLARWPPSDVDVVAVGHLVLLGLGALLPPAAWAAYYGAHGALGALWFDTVSGMPQRISCFFPFAPPTVETMLFAAVLLGGFGVVALARPETAPRGMLPLALLALALAAAGLCVEAARALPLAVYLRWQWVNEFYTFLPWVPLLLLAAAGAAMRGRDDAVVRHVVLFAALALVLLFPYADLAHVMMVLPLFLPLLAFALARFLAATDDAPPGARAAARALALAWPIAAMVPFVQQWTAAGPPAGTPARFAHASGLAVGGAQATQAAALVRDLSTGPARDAGVFLLGNQQMVYFLAGVRSPLERDEFVLYLVATDLTSEENARALADEDNMIAALAAARPVVVDAVADTGAARVRRVFPRLAAFVDGAYGAPVAIGNYRVRLPRP